jgi:hypothetical protein
MHIVQQRNCMDLRITRYASFRCTSIHAVPEGLLRSTDRNRWHRYPRHLFLIVLICFLPTALFLIRISGPTDLESYAQKLNVGYLLDPMMQGHWLVHHATWITPS